MRLVVWGMVVHRGVSREVMQWVMVMLMLVGPKWQDGHRQVAHRRWGHQEQVRHRHLPLPTSPLSFRLSSKLCVLQLPIVHLMMVEQWVEDVYREWHRACRKLHLHVGRVERGGGVVDQHSPQAEVDEVVPPVVRGRTIGLHARLECNVRLLPVFDEVRHLVYQTAGRPPEG